APRPVSETEAVVEQPVATTNKAEAADPSAGSASRTTRPEMADRPAPTVDKAPAARAAKPVAREATPAATPSARRSAADAAPARRNGGSRARSRSRQRTSGS